MSKAFTANITAIEDAKSGRSIMLYMTAPKSFDFKAGQFVFFSKEIDGQVVSRHYSIACSYQDFKDNGELQFIVTHQEGGIMSQWLTQQAKPKDEVRLLGPFGLLGEYLSTAQNFLFISTGSGCAPLLSLYNTLIQSDDYDKIANIYGTRSQKDMPTSLLSAYTLQSSDIMNQMYVSRTAYDSVLSKTESGYVQGSLDKALKFVGRKNLLVYVSGSGKMTEEVVKLLHNRGITSDKIMVEDYGAW